MRDSVDSKGLDGALPFLDDDVLGERSLFLGGLVLQEAEHLGSLDLVGDIWSCCLNGTGEVVTQVERFWARMDKVSHHFLP